MFSESDFRILDDFGDERFFSIYRYILIHTKYTPSDYNDPVWYLNIFEDFPYLTTVDYEHDNTQLKKDFANQFNNFTIKIKRKFVRSVLASKLEDDSRFLKIMENPYA